MKKNAVRRAGASRATLIRQIVMVLILLVVAGAAVYDFQVARPAAKNAYDTVMKLADEHVRSSKPPLTAADVQKALNRRPSYSEKGPNKYVEKYSWISGVPWRSYYIWVVYTPGETPYFQDVLLNEELPEEDRPDYTPPPPAPAPPPGEPVGVGGPGGGAPSGGRGGARDNQRPPAEEPSGGDKSQDSPASGKGSDASKAPPGQPPTDSDQSQGGDAAKESKPNGQSGSGAASGSP
ncbi:MAG: hypothetical protein KatS3mg109_1651 [Pirellulaceae bacterium]|nr:MAG: hypothetical protein KatS3mg109_1651 [Pirellulaceae bacterium]